MFSARRVRRLAFDSFGSRKHVQDCDSFYFQVSRHQHQHSFDGAQPELQHEATTRPCLHRVIWTESGNDWAGKIQRIHIDNFPHSDGHRQHQRLTADGRFYEAIIRVRGHPASFRCQRFERSIRHAKVCETSWHSCDGNRANCLEKCLLKLLNNQF